MCVMRRKGLKITELQHESAIYNWEVLNNAKIPIQRTLHMFGIFFHSLFSPRHSQAWGEAGLATLHYHTGRAGKTDLSALPQDTSFGFEAVARTQISGLSPKP